jgi:hypothetical protein
MKRAWRTFAMGVESIVAASSRGQAIARTLKSIDEAGYRGITFKNIRAIRAPQHDRWAEVDASSHCWSEQYLPALFAHTTPDRAVKP